MIDEHESAYYSYLVRCWVAPSDGGKVVERLILERVSGPPGRWGFASIEELSAFLCADLAAHEVGAPPEQLKE